MANRQQVNMNSYVGMNSTWDPCKALVTHHGGITQGIFGRLLVDQGANKVNSQHGSPETPTPPRQSIAHMLPSHVTSKFNGEQF